jgi:hypothetical protein
VTNTASETLCVVVEREVPFPPHKIWRALTQPHLIEEWLMKNDFQAVVGHRFNFRADWGAVDCQVMASSRTRRCLTPGVPTVSGVSSPGLSPRRAPGPTCAWSSRDSGRISSRPTRAPRAAGRGSLRPSSRYWRASTDTGECHGRPGRLHSGKNLGPVGFEPTTKGFTCPRRFRREWTISSPVHCSHACGCGMLYACHQGRSSPQVVSAPSAGVPAARLRIAMGC